MELFKIIHWKKPTFIPRKGQEKITNPQAQN